MASKQVTVHYRRIVDRNLEDINFEPSFNDGLDARIQGARLRETDTARITTSADGLRMCLLTPEASPQFSFGEVAVFRDGDVPVAETDPGGHLHLRTIALAGNEQAVRGSSYFMVRGPHVALLHHDSSTRFVQDYFRWLLRQPLGSLASDELVSLVPLIDVGGRPLALRAVRSLKLRAEFEAPAGGAVTDGPSRAESLQTFSRMIDRRPLTGVNVRNLLNSIGMTGGTLGGLTDADFVDLEFELIVKKREHNRIQPLPESIIDGVMADGLDRAAEFVTPGARRRGDAVVANFSGMVEVQGAYYELGSVQSLLWEALGRWASEELI